MDPDFHKGPRRGGAAVSRERSSRFVELFRTTPPRTVCPNFYVLRHANGCLFKPLCTYCYLKSSFWYLDRPHVFTNTRELLEEVEAWIGREGLESYVLNTGNLSDSLVFEEARPLVRDLVEVFRRRAEQVSRPHSLLLVTKAGADLCQRLLASKACSNVIVSFSVNAPEAAAQHERGAARVQDRLEAAWRLKAAGWRVRIRLDPVILGFDYTWIASEIRRLKPERVTIGTLRAEKGLVRLISRSFPSLPGWETAEGGALRRYSEDLRHGLYRHILDVIGPGVEAGLCEETAEMWDRLGLNGGQRLCNCGL